VKFEDTGIAWGEVFKAAREAADFDEFLGDPRIQGFRLYPAGVVPAPVPDVNAAVKAAEDRLIGRMTQDPDQAKKIRAFADAATGELDETPTVCSAPECGRTRPRWTMMQTERGWECDPAYRMSCGVCMAPGEAATHYTEEEHQHPERYVVNAINGLMDQAEAEARSRRARQRREYEGEP